MSKKLPFVVSDIPRDLRMFLDRLRELITGSGQDRLVTAKELADSGVATVDQAGNLAPVSGTTTYGTPPAPTNVVVTAGTRSIFIEWDEPLYNGHAYSEVWRHTSNVIGDAVRVAMVPGSVYNDPVGSGVTRYYWVRFINEDSTPGAFNAVAGTAGTTVSEVTTLLSSLTGQITTSQLTTALNARIDLIDGSASTAGTIPYQLANLQGQIDDLNDTPTYDNATTYQIDDLVKYEGGLYKATAITTGNLPTDEDYWIKIGDYNSLADAVAALSTDVSTLTTDLTAETTARTSLATQIRGDYAGTELTGLTSGLLFEERQARSSVSTALTSEVSARETLAAQIRGDYTGNDIDALTAGLLFTERTARVTAVNAVVSSVETLSAQVNDETTGLPATYALLTTDYYTGATVDAAIASSTTSLRAYADIQSKIFRQSDAPTKRGDVPGSDPAVTMPLIAGDLWIDSNDANKTYVWNGSSWTASTDTAVFDAWITATYTPGQTSLQTQVDAKIETWFQDSDPSVAWTTEALRNAHNGDLWYDTDATTKKLKRYRASDNTWQDIDDQTAIDAAAAAAAAQSTADGKITTFAQNDVPTAEGVGDLWIDTNDGNKPYRWTGSEWASVRDASISAVDARVTTVEQTKIGYATVDLTGIVFDNNGTIVDKAGVDAWNLANPGNTLTWNVGLPLATAVKQVAVTDGQGNTAAIEQAFLTQRSVNNGLYAQYTVKVDNNGFVSGFGLASTSVNGTPLSEFTINADRFSVVGPGAIVSTYGLSTTVEYTLTSTLWTTTTNHNFAVNDYVKFTNVPGRPVPVRVSALVYTELGTLIPNKFYTDGVYLGTVGVSATVSKLSTAYKIPFIIDSGVVYIDNAVIKDGTITNAKIANATIEAAKIADATITGGKIANATITAANITDATITGSKIANSTITNSLIADSTITTAKVANSLESTNYSVENKLGWQINKAGTATFNQVNVRGSIAGGNFSTYDWPTINTYGFYLGSEGIRLGNLNNSKYFQVTYDGNVSAPGLSILNGVATFSGGLSAATGTFAGTLTAAAVNAVNTVNIAGQAVTFPATSVVSSYDVGGGGSATIISVTVDTSSAGTSGCPVIIMASLSIARIGNAGLVTISVQRNGSTIRSYAIVTDTSFRLAVFNFVDSPGSGNITYSILMTVSDIGSPFPAAGTQRAANISLAAIAAKR